MVTLTKPDTAAGPRLDLAGGRAPTAWRREAAGVDAAQQGPGIRASPGTTREPPEVYLTDED